MLALRKRTTYAPTLLLAWINIWYGIGQVAFCWRNALSPKVWKLGDLILEHQIYGLLRQDLCAISRRGTIIEQCRKDLWVLVSEPSCHCKQGHLRQYSRGSAKAPAPPLLVHVAMSC